MKPPYPKYVICPDVEGLAKGMTAGKRYEVHVPCSRGFEIKWDGGVNKFFFWEGSNALNGADWIIPEDEMPEEYPPEWAVKLAKERAGLDGLDHTFSNSTVCSIEAHARTIAKYEQEPADPDLLLAREMAAQDVEVTSANGTADVFRAGKADNQHPVTYALATIKHIRKHGLPS